MNVEMSQRASSETTHFILFPENILNKPNMFRIMTVNIKRMFKDIRKPHKMTSEHVQ